MRSISEKSKNQNKFLNSSSPSSWVKRRIQRLNTPTLIPYISSLIPMYKLLLIPLLFLSSCTSEWPKNNSSTAKPLVQKNYYDVLYAECNNLDVSEKNGCIVSVEKMRRNGFREVNNGTCPDGMVENMNKTIWSKRWCEPNTQKYNSGKTLIESNSGENLPTETLSNKYPYYYKLASKYCAEDALGSAWCMNGIGIMRYHGYKMSEWWDCPPWLKVDGHTVPGGLTWCAPSDAYYADLRKSCATDVCCLSSVDAMEQGKYLETKDSTCIDELAPNRQRCLSSKQWCQYSFPVKDFWSGFILRQTPERTQLYYYEKLIRDWSHTPPRVYPFVENEWCQELFESSMRKNPNPLDSNSPLSYRKYIWNLFTAKEQKACMKAFYSESVRVIPYDNRFVNILWSNYQSYNISLYDTISGNAHDFLGNEHWDTVKKIELVDDTIVVKTGFTKRIDTTIYTTIFNSDFSGVVSTIVTD